jgi:hypothetical protein
MQDEPISLDDYLSSRFFDVPSEKLRLYEALLGALLKKYAPANKKIEINLLKAYTDIILDITVDDSGMAKLSWGEEWC